MEIEKAKSQAQRLYAALTLAGRFRGILLRSKMGYQLQTQTSTEPFKKLTFNLDSTQINHFLLKVAIATDEIKIILARHLNPVSLGASEHSSAHSQGVPSGTFGNL